ncbi:hypothetical protein V5O48_012577 [Marasmius crinis-equi]|uniref:Uncharacterized protein n=1 Tax=Marasmius crinis-equi TaxID=585013 RepID=A0ABR3F2P0_9AGAR
MNSETSLPLPIRVPQLRTSAGTSIDPSGIVISCSGTDIVNLVAQAVACSKEINLKHPVAIEAVLNFVKEGPLDGEEESDFFSREHGEPVKNFCNLPRYRGLKTQYLGVVWTQDHSEHPALIGKVPVFCAPSNALRDGTLTFGTPIQGSYKRLGWERAAVIQPTPLLCRELRYILAQTDHPYRPIYILASDSKLAEPWPEVYSDHLKMAAKISPVLLGTPNNLNEVGMMERARQCYEEGWVEKLTKLRQLDDVSLDAIRGGQSRGLPEELVPFAGNAVLAGAFGLRDWMSRRIAEGNNALFGDVLSSFPLPPSWSDPAATEPPADPPTFLAFDPTLPSSGTSSTRRSLSQSTSSTSLDKALWQTFPTLPTNPSRTLGSNASMSSGESPSSPRSIGSTNAEDGGKREGRWSIMGRLRKTSLGGKKVNRKREDDTSSKSFMSVD